MLNYQEKQELKALCREILGDESALNRLKRGVDVRALNEDGTKQYTKNGMAVYRKVMRSEKDILEELRKIKQERIKKELLSVSGKA